MRLHMVVEVSDEAKAKRCIDTAKIYGTVLHAELVEAQEVTFADGSKQLCQGRAKVMTP